jgi:murein DD-endopeptidase MepM/ murein hydrolase activator NlpD
VRSPAPPGRRRPRTSWAALLVGLAMIATPAAAGAQARSSSEVEQDLQREQRRAAELGDQLGAVQSEIADAEVELAELGARLEDARGRLRAAEGQVALGEAALDEAREEQADAEQAHDRAEDVLARTETELAVQESVLADQIVQSFKYGTAGAQRGAMMIEVLRRAEDPNSFAVGMKQLKVVVDTQESTVQRVFELRDVRSEQADDAAKARARAVQAAADAADALRHLEAMRDEAATIAAQVAEDEERQRVVLASLEADAAQKEAVLQRVAVRQDELSRELRQRRAEEEAARRAEEERKRRAAQQTSSARGSGGGAAGGPSVPGGYCPVPGGRFINDWGFPRSGGRGHEGTDIFADTGTPIIAIADGVVTTVNPPSRPTSLGGITVTYRTADGSHWYNAHLDTISAGVVEGARVQGGQQIGTVGNSGNARTTPPHNHLGRYMNGPGQGAVNPYPTLIELCR